MTNNEHIQYPKNYDGFIRFSIATDTVMKKIQKYKNDQLSVFGLRSMHLMFLYCLSKAKDGMTPGELAQSCSVDKAFISRISSELRTLGYVDYDPLLNDESMRYKKRLTLTPKGKEIMVAVNEKVKESVDVISAGISPDDLEIFYKVLAAFDRNLFSLTGEE